MEPGYTLWTSSSSNGTAPLSKCRSGDAEDQRPLLYYDLTWKVDMHNDPVPVETFTPPPEHLYEHGSHTDGYGDHGRGTGCSKGKALNLHWAGKLQVSFSKDDCTIPRAADDNETDASFRGARHIGRPSYWTCCPSSDPRWLQHCRTSGSRKTGSLAKHRGCKTKTAILWLWLQMKVSQAEI